MPLEKYVYNLPPQMPNKSGKVYHNAKDISMALDLYETLLRVIFFQNLSCFGLC